MLLASIAAPLVATPLLLTARDWRKGSSMAALSLILAACFLVSEAVKVCKGFPSREVYNVEPSLYLVTLEGDGFNIVYALTVLVVCTLSVIYASSYMRHFGNPGVFLALYLVASSSLVGVALSGSLTTFFLFYEFFLIPSWLLILYWGGGEAKSISFKYLLFTEAGALVTMAGIALTYDQYRTLAFAELREILKDANPNEVIAPISLLIVGPLVKSALFPLHAWLPDAHSEAPTPVSVQLTLAVGIGNWALARILLFSAPIALEVSPLRATLMAMAAVTMIYGSLAALSQRDLKRVLAFSSISQSGYALLGIASGAEVGIASSALIFVAHSMAKSLLFMVSGCIERATNTRLVDRLGGLADHMPLAAISAFIGFLCLSGIPPTLGFWAELEIFFGVFATTLSSGHYSFFIAGIALLVSSTLTAAYGLSTFKKVFYGAARELEAHESKLSITQLIPLVLALLLIALGAYPSLIVNMLTRTE